MMITTVISLIKLRMVLDKVFLLDRVVCCLWVAMAMVFALATMNLRQESSEQVANKLNEV